MSEHDAHELLGRVHAAVEVYGGHKSLKAVRKDRRLALVAQLVLALAQQQIPVKPQLQRTLIDALLFDQCGAHLGQVALPGVRKLQEQQFGNDEVHDAVAHEFELLVRRVAVMLTGKRAVRQSDDQIPEILERHRQRLVELLGPLHHKGTGEVLLRDHDPMNSGPASRRVLSVISRVPPAS